MEIPKKYFNLKRPPFSAMSKERLLLAEEIYEVLAEALNIIHKTKHSLRFWKILLEPYTAKIIVNREILEKENIHTKSSTFAHSDMFEKSFEGNIYENIRSLNILVKSIGNYTKIKRQLQNNNQIASGFHYADAVAPEVDTILDNYYPFLYPIKRDIKKRNILIQLSEDHSKIFISNIIKHIPKVYVEYFDFFMNRVPLYNPDKKVFHVSMLPNMFLRFIIAKYTNHNSILKYYQHGGYYGEFKHHNSHHYEGSIADHFMSWGWKINDNDVPSKAYRLEKFKRNYNKNLKKVYDLLLIYDRIYHINKEHYERQSAIFFKEIDRTIHSQICARPRPRSAFNRKGDLKFLASHVTKIDSGYTQLSDLISKTKLVVLMNHPSTTIFECLYANQPVVALLENDDPSDIVIPYYDFLLEQGLFHSTIESLVKHLNQTNLNLWWTELNTNKKYIEFKKTYLRDINSEH